MVHVQNSQEQITKSQDSGTYSGTYDEIKNEFNQLNPAPINVACTAWSRLAGHLGTVANELMTRAGHPLHEAWESKTSPDAQQQLQLAQATAQALADQCMQMARATDWAYQYAQWYKDHVPGDGLITTGADADRINEHRVALLSRYNEVIGYCIPSQVQSSLVTNGQGAVSDFHATPGPGPAGPGPMGPGPGPGPGTTPVAPPHHLPPPHVYPPPHTPGPGGPGPGPTGPGPIGPGPIGPGPGGPGPGSDYNPNSLPTLDNSSSLAGFDPSGGAGSGFGPGGASGLGAGGASGLGGGGLGGGGLGAGGLGAGDASGLAGSGAGMGAGAGGGGIAGGAGAAGGMAGGAGGRPGMMMPMHGSGQGGDDERERSTWLAEDDDIWGTDDAPPGVIGG